MERIEVRRDELLAVLRKNKEEHVVKYKKALQGYIEACLIALQEKLDEINGIATDEDMDSIQYAFSKMDRPDSHEEAYDLAIQMTEMAQGNITLSEASFDQYVNDNWGWTARWADTTSKYA